MWTRMLALGLLAATPALAQRPLAVGLAGGVSVPEGSLRDGAKTGWHALATLALSSPMQPIGLRLDAAYNRFALSDAVRATLGSGSQTVSSFTLGASYRLPMVGGPASPYLITGLGAYRAGCTEGCDASTRYGWNVGLGTKLYTAGIRSFLEARYHRTTRAGRGVHYIPVTLGLLF